MIRLPVLCLFVLSLLAAAYLGFASIHLPHDKAVHFGAFFLLTAEFYFLWDRFRPWKLTLLCMTLGACVGSEYIQNLVNPARIFDFVDIIYNVLGSLLALTLCVWFQSWKRRPSNRPDLLEPSPPSEDEIDGFVNVRMSDMPV